MMYMSMAAISIINTDISAFLFADSADEEDLPVEEFWDAFSEVVFTTFFIAVVLVFDVEFRFITEGLNVPPPPSNYTKLYAINITYPQNSNLSINADLHYSCNSPQNETFPFEYSGNAWKMITDFNINSKLCRISFQVPGDLLLALMKSNTSKPKPSSINTSKTNTTAIKKVVNTTTIPTNTSQNSSTGKSSSSALSANRKVEISVLIILIAAILIYIIHETMLKDKKKKKNTPNNERSNPEKPNPENSNIHVPPPVTY